MKPDVFLEPLRRGRTTGSEGEVPLSSAIWEIHAMALYRLVESRRPASVLEVGMGHAISTLAILGALDEIGSGKLASIDPNQSTDWKGAGRLSVERAGLARYHTVIEEPDYLALPTLVRQSQKIDLAYIDGWHTFDHVLLDAFYIDKLLSPGGVIGFNDCGFPAVQKALRWFRRHRRYHELDVGLPMNYDASSLPRSVARRIVRRPQQDRYFVKTDDWLPPWNYSRRF